MSIIFSDNFNTGFSPNWNQVADGNLTPIGCNYTKCFACALQNCWFSGNTHYANLTARFDYAMFNTRTPGDDEVPLFQFAEGTAINTSTTGIEVVFVNDGSVSFRLLNGSGVLDQSDSAGSLFSTDGTWQGIQVTLAFSGGSFTIKIYRNNILKHTWTRASIHSVSSMNMWALVNLTSIPTTFSVALDNFEVEDQVLVTDFAACTAPQLTATSCSNPPTPPVVNCAIKDADGALILDSSGDQIIVMCGGGIVSLVPGKTNDVDEAIPNPYIITAMIGDE